MVLLWTELRKLEECSMLTPVNIYDNIILTGVNIILSCVNIVCRIHLFKNKTLQKG